MFSTFKRFWKYIDNKKRFVVVVLIALPITALKSYQAFHIKNVIDVGFVESSSLQAVVFQCAILLLLQILQMPLRVFYYHSLRSISEGASLKLRENVFKKFKAIGFKDYESKDQGELLTLSVSDTRFFSEGFQQFAVLLKEPITCLGYLSVAFIQDWQLALLVLIVVPIFIFILKFITKKIKKYSMKAQSEYGNLSLKVRESIEGNLEIKSYNLQHSFQEEFEASNRKYTESQIRAISYEEHSSPLVELVGSGLMALILFFAHKRFADNSLSIGGFISFFTALGLFMNPLKKINNANKLISRAIASLDRIENFFMVQNDKREEDILENESSRVESIEFQNVDFSYGDHQVLKDLSFSIRQGEKVAFVGKSGSGKSTIANLLLGLYQIQGGDYLINGESCKPLSSNRLRSFFEYLPQKSYFFEGNFIDNISPHSGASSVTSYFEALNINFLDNLDVNQELNIDSSFSGGEKQRMALLRAMITEKSVLLMDEATSALDRDNEVFVSKNLYEMLEGRTFICIAHRLETIKNFDKIFLLKNGSIVEKGTHQELIEANGEYKKLYFAGVSD